MNYCQRCGLEFYGSRNDALCPQCEADDDLNEGIQTDARRDEAAYRELHRSDNG